MEIILNYFSEKILHQSSWMGSEDILKFCTMKEVKRQMKDMLMVFPKKSSVGQMYHFHHSS